MTTNYAFLKTSVHETAMAAHVRFRLLLASLLACVGLLQPNALPAESIAVRHMEGVVHGFLVLRTLDGNPIADGDLAQVTRAGRVTSHLIFHFKDGSIHEETTVFSERGNFRLLSDHLVQKGPAFKRPMETSIDASTGQVTVRYTDDDGKEKVLTERLKLPPDVANGMVFTLLKNIQPGVPRTTVSMVVATPKPRLVKLVISPRGEEPFSIGASNHKSMHYVVKTEIGGAAGLVAPLVGKQPPDFHVWILGGEAPAFVKSELPLYEGGPIWRIELAIPVWPQGSAGYGLKPEEVAETARPSKNIIGRGPGLAAVAHFVGTPGRKWEQLVARLRNAESPVTARQHKTTFSKYSGELFAQFRTRVGTRSAIEDAG